MLNLQKVYDFPIKGMTTDKKWHNLKKNVNSLFDLESNLGP